MSPGRILPMSPCSASTGCRAMDGVPVEAMDAEIFLRDEIRLAHATEDHGPFAVQNRMNRLSKGFIQAVPQLSQCIDFGLENPVSKTDYLF